MLKQFTVRNFRNFTDNLTLDMTAGRYAFKTENVRGGIVKNAIIYGYNACGKSNLALAVFDIVSTVTDKHFEPQYYTNYKNVFHPESPAYFSYTFLFRGKTLQYTYEKNTWQTTQKENLFIDGEEKLSFSRETGLLRQSFAGTSSLGKTITNNNLSAVKYLRSNASLDTSDEDNKIFLDFCDFVDNMLLFWCLQNRSYMGYESGIAILQDSLCEKDHLERYNGFLSEMGIDRRIVKKKAPDGSNVLYYDFGKGRLLPYDGSTMSNGEGSLFLFFYWLTELEDKVKPSLLFIDEFDAFYHINLSEKIVEKLKNTPGQVILTTHNDSLISNEILRPDCYYMLQNNHLSSFDKTTPKEIRENQNLRRMFDAGTFDVV